MTVIDDVEGAVGSGFGSDFICGGGGGAGFDGATFVVVDAAVEASGAGACEGAGGAGGSGTMAPFETAEGGAGGAGMPGSGAGCWNIWGAGGMPGMAPGCVYTSASTYAHEHSWRLSVP